MPSPLDGLPEFSPTVIGADLGAPNPIQEVLTARGVPWTVGLAELVARYGVSTHPSYDWDVVAIRPDPFDLEGCIFPLATLASAGARTSTAVPDYFSTDVWFYDDPLTNLRATARSIARHLGPAVVGRFGAGGIRCEWTAGAASVSLRASYPELQPFPLTNPAWERDPRLRTACHMVIEPGWRLPLSSDERAWVESSTRLVPFVGDDGAASLSALARHRESSYLGEFARDPIPACESRLRGVGLSGDRRALVICAEGLLVVPLTRITGVFVQKLRPAKGSGGSSLQVRCTPGDGEADEKTIYVDRHPSPNGLDATARRLSKAIGRPVTVDVQDDA